MTKVIKAFMKLLLVTMISDGVYRGIHNKLHGRTFLGRKHTPRKMYMDADDLIHASPDDVKVS